MTGTTLKSLYKYLRLIENASELKRRMPASANQRSLKEGLAEIGKLVSFRRLRTWRNQSGLSGPRAG